MKKKIMLIDDDKEFAEELADTLEISGYAAVVANDADEALDIAKKAKPDLILLDLKMPKKSGFQVASELKEDVGIKDIPVIAMSAYYKNGDFSLMTVNNIKKCLHKPFSPEKVVAEIESVLGEG